MSPKISWWRTSFGEEEINSISEAIRNECVSQGKVTEKFENALSELLEVEHVIAVSSGSSALLMALMALGIVPGDEVIIPNRTWISTAHAVHLLGAKVVLVDVENKRPIIDSSKIEECISAKTKAIIPVHLNGRSANMAHIREIAERHSLFVIEDAAQALASKNNEGFLGTQSDIGCFSLSVAKVISTGQGGFAVTKRDDLAKSLRRIRTQGVENVINPENWIMPGFNFRLTDVQASIGLEQLKRLPKRINHLKKIYTKYADHLNETPISLIPVNLEAGEIPIYAEYTVDYRNEWIRRLGKEEIESRPFYPDVCSANYLKILNRDYPNSYLFANKGIYLPSGPSQNISNINKVISTIYSILENNII